MREVLVWAVWADSVPYRQPHMQFYSQSHRFVWQGSTGRLGLYSCSCTVWLCMQQHIPPLLGMHRHRPSLECTAPPDDRTNSSQKGCHKLQSLWVPACTSSTSPHRQSLGCSTDTSDKVCSSHCRPRMCLEAGHRGLWSSSARCQARSSLCRHRTSIRSYRAYRQAPQIC